MISVLKNAMLRLKNCAVSTEGIGLGGRQTEGMLEGMMKHRDENSLRRRGFVWFTLFIIEGNSEEEGSPVRARTLRQKPM